MITTINLKEIIVATLDKHKAEDIVIIDLKNKSDIADFMLITTARSSKHASSLAELVIKELKDNGMACSVEGIETGDWVLIDTMDILLHIFNKEKRELFALEKLWQS
jgi:ribosome-associated protein